MLGNIISAMELGLMNNTRIAKLMECCPTFLWALLGILFMEWKRRLTPSIGLDFLNWVNGILYETPPCFIAVCRFCRPIICLGRIFGFVRQPVYA